MTKGRAESPATLTLPDSGVTLELRKIAPMTIQQIAGAVRKEYPPPEPPVVMVQIGESDERKPEANPADPAYQRTLATYDDAFKTKVGERTMQLIARYGVRTIDNEAVAEFRAQMIALGAPLDPNEDDRDIYVWQLACVSERDMTTLMNTVLSRSQPSEEAVAAHTATFRDNVPGSAATGLSFAEESTELRQSFGMDSGGAVGGLSPVS